MGNVLKYLPLAFQILNEIVAAEAQFASGQPVTVPGIRTYLGKQHIEIDVTVKPIT